MWLYSPTEREMAGGLALVLDAEEHDDVGGGQGGAEVCLETFTPRHRKRRPRGGRRRTMR